MARLMHNRGVGIPVTFGAKTLAGAGGWDMGVSAVTISSGNASGHWQVVNTGGRYYVAPSSTGVAASLGSGPYTLVMSDGTKLVLSIASNAASARTTTEITALLNAWVTTPITATTDILLRDGAYTTFTFAQSMAYPVRIIGPDTLTATVPKSTLSGTNVSVEQMYIAGTTSTSGSAILTSTAVSCAYRKNWIEGYPEASVLADEAAAKAAVALGQTSFAGGIPNSYGVYFNGASSFCEATENFITGFKLCVYINGATDALVEDNFFRYVGAVCIQAGSATRATIRGNNAAMYFGGTSLDAHLDFIFLRTNTDCAMDRNFFIRAADDYSMTKIVRGITCGDNGGFPTTNPTVTNNIIVNNNIGGIQVGEAGEANVGTAIVTGNLLVVSPDQQNGSSYTSVILNNMPSISRSGNVLTAQTGTQSADSGGKVYEVGANFAARDYSDYLDDFAAYPNQGSNISVLIPKNASQMYPGTGTQGHYLLVSDLLAGDHLGAKSKAVRDAFNKYLNRDGYLAA